MNPKIKKVILSLALFLLIVTMGFFSVRIIREKGLLAKTHDEEIRDIRKNYGQAANDLLSGKASRSVEEYRKTMEKEKSLGIKATTGWATLQLAVAEEKNGEYEKSLSHYKRVILNEGMLPLVRAIALTRVAELVLVLPNDVLKNNFFNNNNKTTGLIDNDPFVTQELLLTQAESLYSTAPSAYQLAHLYAEDLAKDASKNQLSEDQKSALAGYFLKKINEADRIKNIFDTTKADKWNKDRLLVCNLNKARISDKLFRINDLKFDQVKMSEAQIEDLFKKALELSKDPFTSLGPENHEYFTRLYYAAFLNNVYGEKRAEDIKKILTPIYSPMNSKTGPFSFLQKEKSYSDSKAGLFVFLQKEKKYPDDAYHKQEILSLSKIDPRLERLLKEAGW